MQDLKERLAELGEKYPLTQRLKQYAQGTYTRGLHFRTVERFGYSSKAITVIRTPFYSSTALGFCSLFFLSILLYNIIDNKLRISRQFMLSNVQAFQFLFF